MEHLELRTAMSTVSDLRSIQAIQRGGHLGVGGLGSMFGGGKDAFCVELVELDIGTSHIIAVRPGQTPRAFATDISTEDARDWLACYNFGEGGLQKS